MKTRVINIHHKVPYDQYIGRGGKFGNPFSHLKGTRALYQVATRDEAVDAFLLWLLEQPALIEDAYRELRGKTLGCFCKPKRCHGDIYVMLIEFIDEYLREIQAHMRENRVGFGKAASDVFKKKRAAMLPNRPDWLSKILDSGV